MGDYKFAKSLYINAGDEVRIEIGDSAFLMSASHIALNIDDAKYCFDSNAFAIKNAKIIIE